MTLALVMSNSSTASAAKAVAATRKTGPMFGLGRAWVSGTTTSAVSLFVLGYAFASPARRHLQRGARL